MTALPDTTVDPPPFRPLRIVAVVLLLLLGISAAAQWYSRSITMPKYCDYPDDVLENVHRLLTEKTPAKDGSRKPYIIAARLTFLIPRESNEMLQQYLLRLQQHLERECR